MRTVVVNAKGGVGKTTIAIHLARYFSDRGRTLLIDLDPQGSSLAWASLSDHTPFSVGRSLSPGFDHVVYDLPPRLPERLPEAECYLCPTLLDGSNFIVFMRVMDMLKEQGKRVIPVAMRVNPSRGEHRERLHDPLMKGAVVIHERAAFATYYALGSTVYDMRMPHAQKARFELSQLTDLLGETP
jgi:chromosome partitioning protein